MFSKHHKELQNNMSTFNKEAVKYCLNYIVEQCKIGKATREVILNAGKIYGRNRTMSATRIIRSKAVLCK